MIYFLIIFFFNFFLFKNYLFISKKYNLYDHPDNFRKTHLKTTPLLGGLLVYLNLIFFILINFFLELSVNYFSSDQELIIFFLICTSFFLLGYCDDKYQLSANFKLVISSINILLLMLFDKSLIIEEVNFTFTNFKLTFHFLDYFFTILCFLLFINSFNMIDGINGQATSYSLYIILIFLIYQVNLIFFISLLIPLCFFLYFNLKEKMFLGDSGTMLVAFIIGYFFIKSHNIYEKFYSDEIFLIMMIPGVELLRLAITRLAQKKHPFSPDRNHIHHYVIKKFSSLKSFLIIQILLIFPFLFYIIIQNAIIVLLISLFIYSCLIILLKKNNI